MNTEQILKAHKKYTLYSKKIEQKKEEIRISIEDELKVDGFILSVHLHYEESPTMSIFKGGNWENPLKIRITRKDIEIKQFGAYSKVDFYIIKNQLGF